MYKFKIVWNHFKTICNHKKWVFYYCKICGLYWRGFKHDFSKFSRIEFSESIKYYTGINSPIDNCKKDKGYSLAWQHHKGRNDHHYEYWMDNFDKGGEPIRMPFECAVEMICDYLGAGQAYSKNANKDFSYKDELNWFINKLDNGCAMHKDTKKFVFLVLRSLSKIDKAPIIKDKKTMKYILKDKYLNKNILLRLYDYSIFLSDETFEEIRKSVEEEN